MTRLRCYVLVLVAVLATAVPALAQTPVSPADIQRLQDSLSQASGEVAQLRTREPGRGARLDADLDTLREEVIYLKVKLRKEGVVPRGDYADVRDRIDDLRSRATASASSAPPAPRPVAGGAPLPAPLPPPPGPPPAPPPAPVRGGVVIPVGTEVDVRLSNPLNSGTAQVEDRFEATTLADLFVDDRVVIPAGSVMRGVVTSVDPATRTNRTAKMTVSFDQVTVNGRAYPVRATVSQALQGEGIKGEASRIGTGAGVGAIIGGILGGFKGAMAGVLIGGGGTIAATEGKNIEIPPGSTLRVRFDSPLTVRESH
jgi:hypothetical protein